MTGFQVLGKYGALALDHSQGGESGDLLGRDGWLERVVLISALFSCLRLNFRRGQQAAPHPSSSGHPSLSSASSSGRPAEGGGVCPYIRKRKKPDSSVV